MYNRAPQLRQSPHPHEEPTPYNRLVSQPRPIRSLTIWQPCIPLREKFQHAARAREESQPLIVAVELPDGTTGYGETHPREYVTGESMHDAVRSIQEIFAPILVTIRPANFGEAIEAASNLPLFDAAGKVITAARAAVELALLDAYARYFQRSLSALAGWVDERWLGPPGSRRDVCFSGVLSGDDPRRVIRSIRKMRLYGLRDFKLKVGDSSDDARLTIAVNALGRGLRNGKLTLRLDANAAWSPDQAAQRLASWEELPIASVEQPLEKSNLDAWSALALKTNLPLMADESLVTPADAEALIVKGAASWFNIRISKNGGLIPAMRLALLAHQHNLQYQLGCMVGETSILSAAGRWFLQLVPNVAFAEGSFGKFLLADDVTTRSLRFGWAGRWKPMTGPGLGVDIDERKLEMLCPTAPQRMQF
jgi:L-Ala-D/L-Glu epimerase